MRTIHVLLIPLFVLVGCSGSEPEERALFESCTTDADCSDGYDCVPAVTGNFCSRSCFSGPDCLSVVQGDRDANFCLPSPRGGDACYQSCSGGACDEIGLPEHEIYVADVDAYYCVCAP